MQTLKLGKFTQPSDNFWLAHNQQTGLAYICREVLETIDLPPSNTFELWATPHRDGNFLVDLTKKALLTLSHPSVGKIYKWNDEKWCMVASIDINQTRWLRRKLKAPFIYTCYFEYKEIE